MDDALRAVFHSPRASRHRCDCTHGTPHVCTSPVRLFDEQSVCLNLFLFDIFTAFGFCLALPCLFFFVWRPRVFRYSGAPVRSDSTRLTAMERWEAGGYPRAGDGDGHAPLQPTNWGTAIEGGNYPSLFFLAARSPLFVPQIVFFWLRTFVSHDSLCTPVILRTYGRCVTLLHSQ